MTAVRVSKKALSELTTDEDQAPSDARPAQFDRLVTVPVEVADAIAEVFAGLPDDQERAAAVIEARRTVEHAWGRAKQSFLEIGRALLRLDERLTRDEKVRLKAGFDRIFPMSEPIASQFRAVARMVDEGRLPAEQCPGAYSIAYQVSLLPPDDLAEARRRGLIGPGTSRAALIAFRRERAASTAAPHRVDVRALRAEHRRIGTQIVRLNQELAALNRRRAEIESALQEGQGGTV